MKDKRDAKIGDMVMVDINSIDSQILTIMNYQPHIFDSGKRVIFLVDKKGMKLYKKMRKYALRELGGNNEV